MPGVKARKGSGKDRGDSADVSNYRMKESEIKIIYCWKVAWVGHLNENYMN